MSEFRTVEAVCASVVDELYKNVIPFWKQFSPDSTHGGFFACLDQHGEVYDNRKFMWLNGRQIWMFARICSGSSDEELSSLSGGKLSRSEMLQLADKAAEFTLKHAFREDGLAYFSLAADGAPYHFERKIFSACFICAGLGALSAHKTLPNSDQYAAKAMSILQSIISLAHDPSPLGRPDCPGAPQVSPMNVPMILLNIICELRIAGVVTGDNEALCAKEEEWCIDEILKHVIPDRQLVLENVSVDGSLIDSYDGRHMNPGHAIEAGWFVLDYAKRVGREDLKATAIQMIEWSFERGWDTEHGGLFYFLDSDGRSPPYLEWNMKLWWPHTEAMIAYAMLYKETRDMHYWKRFLTIYDYTLAHFSDASGGGEWYGYLDVKGALTHSFKGGPYKGCFHVPRALFFVSNILRDIASDS